MPIAGHLDNPSLHSLKWQVQDCSGRSVLGEGREGGSMQGPARRFHVVRFKHTWKFKSCDKKFVGKKSPTWT